MLIQKKKKKTFTRFRTLVLSRHPSHKVLRTQLPLLPFRSVIRLGSTTVRNDKVRVECNSVQSVRNSASKLLMKICFTRGDVKTADWWIYNGRFIKDRTSESINIQDLPYPIIAKSHHGSRGEGNSLLNNQQELQQWMQGKTLSNYIFEKYYSYTREYRLHVTKEGCFYTCRKMLKRDTPEEKKFQRHDDNCVWIMESNPAFDKPVNWDEIVADCVKALNSLGLDIAGFDVKVQSAKDAKGNPRKTCEWIVIESCSAPSFGNVTSEKYLLEIPKVLNKKWKEMK